MFKNKLISGKNSRHTTKNDSRMAFNGKQIGIFTRIKIRLLWARLNECLFLTGNTFADVVVVVVVFIVHIDRLVVYHVSHQEIYFWIQIQPQQ